MAATQLPATLIRSLEGTTGFDRSAFERVHGEGRAPTSIRLHPLKTLPAHHFAGTTAVPWSTSGFYLTERPSFTFDPLFHAGCYYVQEASSMFLEQALRQLTDLSGPLKVLDLSAAPGGKSTLIQSLIAPGSLLVSNEVIRTRAAVLRENMIKWGGSNVVVTQNDPKDFSVLPGFFDVLVVDAPCSGSGLFRREPEAMAEWSESNVMLCSQRQQRILADCWPALKPGGLLVYSTCSYSREEDEDIVSWMKDTFSAEYLPLNISHEWGITDTGSGYRFWPDKVEGEGFFIACFQKATGGEARPSKTGSRVTRLSKKELAVVAGWVETGQYEWVRNEQTVYAWPVQHVDDMELLLQKLRVMYSGIRVGELVRDKMIPDHALAMSATIAPGCGRIGLDLADAIRYLQRKELTVMPAEKGWQMVAYEGHPLGWVNVLPNRVNNYYPKELRILKDTPGERS